MEKTAIVIGRFQVAELHEGHTFLIDYALSRSTQTVIVIGKSPTRCTTDNPLSFEVRKQMINELYPEITCLGLDDCSSDEVWSQNLDNLLISYPNVKLYCSRESFADNYSGKYPVICVQSPYPEISGEKERENISKNILARNNRFFRWGAIWQALYKFPTAYSCVDIAILNNIEDTTYILLGRKAGEKSFRLPGGFVDPTDENYEVAAAREMREETGITDHHGLKYICSQKIDDWRYKRSKDKIITSLFYTYKMSGNEKAGDDLEEIQWFSLAESEEVVFNNHLNLIQKLKDFLLKKKNTYEKKHMLRH